MRYVGQYDYAGHELRLSVRDRLGNPRTAIVFRLVPHEQLEEDGREGGVEVHGVPDDLAALRAAALEQPAENLPPKEGRHQVWRRSRAVRRYVLLRATGACEGCELPGPFMRANGEPYLEPHHTRRVSDAGPGQLAIDDPDAAWAVPPRVAVPDDTGHTMNVMLKDTAAAAADEAQAVEEE